MSIDFSDFLNRFYDKNITNIQLYWEVRDFPDYDFFIALKEHLDKTYYPKISSDMYSEISQSYYRAKKYFREH